MNHEEFIEDSLKKIASISGKGGGALPPKGPGEPAESAYDGGMHERLASLEAVIPTLATKADVEGVRVDIQRGINETHKWMIGTVIGLFLGFGGLFLAMSNALRPSQVQAASPIPIGQPPNIIINVPPYPSAGAASSAR